MEAMTKKIMGTYVRGGIMSSLLTNEVYLWNKRQSNGSFKNIKSNMGQTS